MALYSLQSPRHIVFEMHTHPLLPLAWSFKTQCSCHLVRKPWLIPQAGAQLPFPGAPAPVQKRALENKRVKFTRFGGFLFHYEKLHMFTKREITVPV